jgi:hypothetical protein
MASFLLGSAQLEQCPQCNGVWLDGGEEFSEENPESFIDSMQKYLLYSVSLPERTVRSTIGLAAGTAAEAAKFLIPQSFQTSKTYEIVVRNSLKFLTEDIGGATPEKNADDDSSVDDYLARKAVGNFVDLAGMVTLHLSPLWMLAIVSDLAYGSKSYVIELAKELEKQGLIEDTSTIHCVDDILEAVQNASGNAANMFDTPPLSVDQLKNSLEETRAAIASADYTAIIPEAEMKNYWNEMKSIADKEHVSLLGVSGALTMHSLNKVKNVGQGTLTGFRVAGGLFNRHVIGHYTSALSAINEQGFYQTVTESYSPYVDGVWNNFAAENKTWTENLLNGTTLGNAFQSISGWWNGKSSTEDNNGQSSPTTDPAEESLPS